MGFGEDDGVSFVLAWKLLKPSISLEMLWFWSCMIMFKFEIFECGCGCVVSAEKKKGGERVC